jgi:CheY-like chemotaxis protein
MEPKILYIEDSVLNLRLVRKFLELGGFNQMTEALDGLSGVELALETMPDLILMDINLPDIDGWEATRHIKATPALAKIPIVAVTANTSLDDRRRCFEAGCQGFLAKPMTKNELLDTVRTFLQLPTEASSQASIHAQV